MGKYDDIKTRSKSDLENHYGELRMKVQGNPNLNYWFNKTFGTLVAAERQFTIAKSAGAADKSLKAIRGVISQAERDILTVMIAQIKGILVEQDMKTGRLQYKKTVWRKPKRVHTYAPIPNFPIEVNERTCKPAPIKIYRGGLCSPR